MRSVGGIRKFQRLRNQAKTAGYTVLSSDLATRFTNLGATAGITFTLPSLNSGSAGWAFHFFCAAAYPMVITAPTGLYIYVNGIKRGPAASVLLWQIGHSCSLVFDGTDYHCEALCTPQGADRVVLREMWLRPPGLNADIQNAAEAVREIVNADFELLGVNGVSANATINVEGGVSLSTAGAADDQNIVLPHLDASQSAWTKTTWGTDQVLDWTCSLITGSSITNVIIWAGLKLTNVPVVATDNDQVFFRYEDDVSSGDFKNIYSIGGTDTENTSSVTVAVSTRYDLRINIGSDRIARMFINDILVRTSTALTNTTDLIPYFGIENDGGAGAAKVLRCLPGYEISRKAA